MTTVPIYRPHAAGATGGNYSHGSPAASCRSHIAITQSPSRRLRHRKRPSEITYSTRARILHAHHANVRAFINKYGEKVGALTLTFDHDVPNAERERRYNSLAVNVLRPKYGAAIVVAELLEKARKAVAATQSVAIVPTTQPIGLRPTTRPVMAMATPTSLPSTRPAVVMGQNKPLLPRPPTQHLKPEDEGLTDQEGVITSIAQALDIGSGVDAALGDANHPAWDLLSKS